MRLSERLTQTFSPSPGHRFASVVDLEQAAHRVHARWPDVTPKPPERDRDAIAERALDYVHGRKPWPARMSWMLSAMRAAFDSSPETDPRRVRLRLQPLRDFYAKEVRVSTRPGFLGAACEVYLESYEPEAAHTVKLANSLSAARPRLPARWRLLLEALPELLDPRDGATRLAARIATERDPVGRLRDAGVRSIAEPAFFDHLQTALIAVLQSEIGKGSLTACETLTAWLGGDGKTREKGARDAIAALLLPWARRQPEEPMRRLIQKKLLDLYGDPRLGAPVWNATDPVARGVMLGWLVAASLELFLDVVTEAEKGSHNDMWRRRNPFWRRMLEDKMIADACVVLAPKAQRIAERKAAASGDEAMARWVRSMPRITSGDTSLLVMRINGKVVVEGSHNFKVHVFPRSHRAAPPLHDRDYRYDPTSIRYSLDEGSKQSHLGNWEAIVASMIAA